MKFIPDAQIENEASRLLGKYENCFGPIARPPVPAEEILESILDLNILWEKIPEPEGNSILAALMLDAHGPLVVLNESRLDLINETPGLYQTTLAHEAGHWILHANPGYQSQQPLPRTSQDYNYLVLAESSRQDPRETQAHKFMSYLLMPSYLLIDAIRDLDLQSWSQLYDLRRHFGVTISALRIRLERAKLLYVADNKRLYPSRQEFLGQARLF